MIQTNTVPGLRKIVLIGPESTGKTKLCEELALYFKAVWVPEHARAYLDATDGRYCFEDLIKIAKAQLLAENEAMEKLQVSTQTNQFLFIDTDLYVIKIWSEFVFNRCDNKILQMIAARDYDFYLLCNIDLPWEKDIYREHPDLTHRQSLFGMYKDALVNQHVPWSEVRGVGQERRLSAIDAVEAFFK